MFYCCSTLPDILVSTTSYIQYLSFYRQLLTDALIRDCADSQSTGQTWPTNHTLTRLCQPITHLPDLVNQSHTYQTWSTYHTLTNTQSTNHTLTRLCQPITHLLDLVNLSHTYKHTVSQSHTYQTWSTNHTLTNT